MGLQGPLGAPRDFYGPLGGPGNGMGRGCNMMLSGAGLLDSIRCPTTFVFGWVFEANFPNNAQIPASKKENATRTKKVLVEACLPYKALKCLPYKALT